MPRFWGHIGNEHSRQPVGPREEPAIARDADRHQRITRGATLVVAVVGALALVGVLKTFRDYVQTNPRFCGSCHEVAPEIAIWTESAHRGIRCQRCHHNEPADGLRVLKVYLAGGSIGPEHAPIRVESCTGCHRSHDERWPSIVASVGHRIHVDRARVPCTTCHGRQMHFDRPARVSCLGCHADRGEGATHEKVHCLACHDFISGGEVIRPTRGDCLGCHANRDAPIRVSATAPMQLACYACHRPHAGGGLVPCAECHRRRELAGMHDRPGHQACETCHEAHEWVTTRQHCFRCHENLGDHYADQTCSSCHSFGVGIGAVP